MQHDPVFRRGYAEAHFRQPLQAAGREFQAAPRRKLSRDVLIRLKPPRGKVFVADDDIASGRPTDVLVHMKRRLAIPREVVQMVDR